MQEIEARIRRRVRAPAGADLRRGIASGETLRRWPALLAMIDVQS